MCIAVNVWIVAAVGRIGWARPSPPVAAYSAMSVSYTHLDVYKRQVVARAEANLPLDEPSQGVEIILDLIARVRRELAGISAQSEKRLVGLGVAMPGPFGLKDSDDKWMMPAWQQFPLLEALAAGTGLNAGLQNLSLIHI